MTQGYVWVHMLSGTVGSVEAMYHDLLFAIFGRERGQCRGDSQARVNGEMLDTIPDTKSRILHHGHLFCSHLT
jgi:hypothetical protein